MVAAQNRWIDLSDFTPGIFGDYHASATPSSSATRAAIPRNGAATVENTYRCVASPSGGLEPLPGMDENAYEAGAVTTLIPNAATTNYASRYPALYLLDAIALGQPHVITSQLPAEGAVQVATLWGAILNAVPGVNPYEFIQIGRSWAHEWNGASWAWQVGDYYFESSETGGWIPDPVDARVPLPGANLTTWRGASTTGGPPIPVANLAAGVAGCNAFQVSHGVAAIPAVRQPWTTYDTDVAATYPCAAIAFLSGHVFFHPNPTTPTVPSTHVPNAGVLPSYPHYMLGHQGRTVALCRAAGSGGFPTLYGFYVRDEYWYTPPLDPRSQVFTAGPVRDQAADDNIVGPIAFGASLSQDEMLLVRDKGGAIVVRGDLDNPTVQRLPGVESTYNCITCVPAVTPLGVVYASRNGIFAWNGGETSDRLSDQIDGYFWDFRNSTTEYFIGNHGRLDFWHPFIAVPNNYLFDTRTQSWWRLEPTSTLGIAFSHYSVDPSTNRLLAFPYKATANNAQVFRTFTNTYLAPSWSWQSQPIIESRDNLLAVQELEIMVSPGSNINTNQTLAVTITGYNADGSPITPVTETFTFSGVNGAQPIIMRKDVHAQLNVRYMQVRFVADGGSTGGGNGNAPKLLSCRFAVRESNMPAKS